MIYITTLWSTFTWHIEDSALQSINYEHQGCGRTWYSVPTHAKELFDKKVKHVLFSNIECTPDILAKKCTMFSPIVLKYLGVPVYKTTQDEKDFIITSAGGFFSWLCYL